MCAIKASMPSTPWQCVMHISISPTSSADGRALSMIPRFSTPACSMHTWKVEGARNGWLLGDRRYGIQPYLLTPFRPDSVSTQPQKRYQKAHTKTRNTIERAFGLWKARFRCLDASGGALQFDPSRCCLIITATAVLHNMCVFDNTPLPGYEEQPPHEPDVVIEVPAHLQSNAGVLVRDRLINDVFH